MQFDPRKHQSRLKPRKEEQKNGTSEENNQEKLFKISKPTLQEHKYHAKAKSENKSIPSDTSGGVKFELSKETREQMRYNTEMYVRMIKK